MFCHQYSTRACVIGNNGVRSLWDNVASFLFDDNLIVRSGCDCQHQGGRELGSSGMVSICKVLINVVTSDKREDANTLEPKGKWSGTDAPNCRLLYPLLLSSSLFSLLLTCFLN